MSYQVLAPQGKIFDIHYVIGSSGGTTYLLTWAKGPNGISTDVSAAADAVNGVISGLNRARERTGDVLVTVTPGRSLRLKGYEGREYALTTGSVSGVLRILSKQIGDEREVFLLGVLKAPGSAVSGDEFLNSFKIR